MTDAPRSPEDDAIEGLNECALAILVACQHRGPLAANELQTLLDDPDVHAQLVILVEERCLEELAGVFRVTRAGAQRLDAVLEGVERELTPDDPAFVRRFQREEPSLPFDANTVWAEAVCANFRVDPDALARIVPDDFELDLYDGHGFVSLTISRLQDFGIGHLPRMLRMNFYQSTYRAHVSYTDFRGETRRGCYFVRSETNSRIMSLTANLLPEFRAHRCGTHPILMARHDGHLVVTVDSGDDPAGKVVLVLDTELAVHGMPPDSVFPSIPAAYDYIVDFHDAFSHDPDRGEIFILRIERGGWDIDVLDPVDAYFGYLEEGPFPSGAAVLDSVFYFRDTPYRWLPLVKETRPRGHGRPG
ncbi:MAG: hypothetical protein CMJ83_13745 [Planctomycetes bacterium]|nr:hypothetical protein [Planctomycetota bacterium]